MKILEKCIAKAASNGDEPAVTLAFLGDSITQGCFELVERADAGFDNNHDRKNAYPAKVAHILGILYPTVPVNVINAGVAGKSAPHGLARLDRDVISHKPDLTVVCFGVNDSGKGVDGIGIYTDALAKIFDRLTEAGSEVIFMTPSMMADHISQRLTSPTMQNTAERFVKRQQAGVLDQYVAAAKELCATKNIPVCDCYQLWKSLRAGGVDTTQLLANYINHPTRDMHWLFAYELVKTMFA